MQVSPLSSGPASNTISFTMDSEQYVGEPLNIILRHSDIGPALQNARTDIEVWALYRGHTVWVINPIVSLAEENNRPIKEFIHVDYGSLTCNLLRLASKIKVEDMSSETFNKEGKELKCPPDCKFQVRVQMGEKTFVSNLFDIKIRNS